MLAPVPQVDRLVHGRWCPKNAQLVLEQACCKIYSHCLFPACWQVVTSLAADLLRAWWTQQPCYKLLQQLVIGLQSTTFQQVVSNKLATTCQNNSIATTCWQACYKLVANTAVLLTSCEIFMCVVEKVNKIAATFWTFKWRLNSSFTFILSEKNVSTKWPIWKGTLQTLTYNTIIVNLTHSDLTHSDLTHSDWTQECVNTIELNLKSCA